ncbi:MAG: hypothetical protein PVG84_00615 [Desulfobacterales bacterium]
MITFTISVPGCRFAPDRISDGCQPSRLQKNCQFDRRRNSKKVIDE